MQIDYLPTIQGHKAKACVLRRRIIIGMLLTGQVNAYKYMKKWRK